MAKTRLSSPQNFAGRTIILPPPVNEATFDKDNILEVDEKDAPQLIADTIGSIDLFDVDKRERKVVEDDVPGAAVKSDDEISPEILALGEKIEAADTATLIEMVKASVSDEAELKKLAGYTDRRLKNYLLKKIGLPAKVR